MGTPVGGEFEALLAEVTATLRDGSIRLDVLDEAVQSILTTMRALSEVVDRMEAEMAELRREVASTRKIAKQAKKASKANKTFES